MKNLKVENLKNLRKVIDKLNAPKVYEIDGELKTFESPFDFVITQRDDLYPGVIAVYDRNEEYNMDYEENMSCLLGTSFTDDILPKLEDAIKEDLKNPNAYLEHYDLVIMTICY